MITHAFKQRVLWNYVLGFGFVIGIGWALASPAWGEEVDTAKTNPPVVSNAVVLPGPENESKVAHGTDALLDKEVFQGKKDLLASQTSDQIFLRRVYLDLVGRIPSPEEITSFSLDSSPEKRQAIIQHLLSDSDFGKNWARYWRDVILYRRGDDRGLLASQSSEDFLTEQLNNNVSWDKIAQSFITAQGSVVEEGETALIMAHMADPNEVAAETSRIFLGVQISCAQCHDHPTDRWKREQFHSLAAFFPRIQVRRAPGANNNRSFEVVSRDNGGRARGNNQQQPNGPEHFMPDLKDPNSRGTLMTPVFFVTGQSMELGKKDLERREVLASWITAKENPWFAKAFVNRIWGELVGEGFYEPLDDMGPDRICSAPETLDHLAGQFAAHDYDIKWLYEAIMLTEAYQRSSRPRRNSEELPFTANVPQRLRADQLYDVLFTSLGLNNSIQQPNRGGPQQLRAANGPRGQFNQLYGFDPSVPRGEVTGTIPQALALMNSPQIQQALNGRGDRTMLGKLINEIPDDESLVVELYLRVLAREPNSKELGTTLDYAQQIGNRIEAFEDVLWSLVNRSEFLYRQ